MNRAAKEARKHPEKNAPPELHIDFSLKMGIIEKLEKLLRDMGKRVTVESC